MNRIAWAATVGIATGIIGLAFASVPLLGALDVSIGLPLLFHARGPVRAPAHIAIVSIDETVATRMGLPASVRDWPRSTHGALVDRLVELGASAIAFDIQFFRHADPASDLAFSESIRQAQRVVLVQRLAVARIGEVEHWERQDPIPLLAEPALALAPVPLPDLPVVSWAWSFLASPTGEEVPSLTAVLLQISAMPVTDTFRKFLAGAGIGGLESLPHAAAGQLGPRELLTLMQGLRSQVRLHPAAAARGVAEGIAAGRSTITSAEQVLLRALLDLYSTSSVRSLNFYGPPGTICTVPYDVVLKDAGTLSCQFRDAVVFVGLGKARVARSDQADTYHTVYPAADGVDFSGVEIHATALSNLLDGTTLRTPTDRMSVTTVVVVGTILGTTSYWVRTRRRWTKGTAACRLHAALAGAAVSVTYCGVVYMVFTHYRTQLPVIIPLVVQLPIALVVGFLVPPARHREQIRAICLATDAEGSTAMGQKLAHGPYAQLMEEYREMLLSAMRAHGGEPVPPEGDGLICVWRCPAPPPGNARLIGAEKATRQRACGAAIDIVRAVRQFNQRQPVGQHLPTRIGLTLGTVTIDSDADRGVFEVFGDTVNIAARLRDLSRELGSLVLASREVVESLEDALPMRHVPVRFSLKGVQHSPTVFELLDATFQERLEEMGTSRIV